MTKYGLHGKLQATAGNADKLAAILIKASELVATAKGCHLYVVGKDPTDENAVWVTEIWDSKEDHDNSLQVGGVKELIAQAMPLLDGRPEKGQELEILGGAGIQ
jgi:quinol monooxygenase YgiN